MHATSIFLELTCMHNFYACEIHVVNAKYMHRFRMPCMHVTIELVRHPKVNMHGTCMQHA